MGLHHRCDHRLDGAAQWVVVTAIISDMVITILGSVPSKKNSRVTTASGRSFPNKTYTSWEREALKQLGLQKWERTEQPLNMFCKFYMKDLVGRDLDNMLSSVLDTLKDQKRKINGKMTVVRYGVFPDDSWRTVKPILMDAELDRLNPRVEIHINEPLADVLTHIQW